MRVLHALRRTRVSVLMCCLATIFGASCSYRAQAPVSVNWLDSLPVLPGVSLRSKKLDGREKQVVRFFRIDPIRSVRGSAFISGTGYVEINGGGTVFAGANRALDPYLEVTITSPKSQTFTDCRKLLMSTSFDQDAVAITGVGYFASWPGIGERRLGVLRLDSISSCEIAPRR